MPHHTAWMHIPAQTGHPRSMTTSHLIPQLRALAQLTATESQVARSRVGQARTEAVRRELRRNAANADGRRRRIENALAELGAVPDVVTPVLGRGLAVAKAAVDQLRPIDEALLDDLALEHELRDRARYVTVLARRADRPGIARLGEELVEAHSATVDWLTTVLAEEALGGPAALSPTPLQQVVAGLGAVMTGPARFAVERLNRAAHTVRRTGTEARDVAAGAADELHDRGLQVVEEGREQAGRAASSVRRAGRGALARTERVAEREGAARTAEAVHGARRDLGALSAAELPVARYEEMNAPDAIAALRTLAEPDDLTAVIAFEEAHKNRSGVVSAARTRYAAVAGQAADTR